MPTQAVLENRTRKQNAHNGARDIHGVLEERCTSLGVADTVETPSVSRCHHRI